MKITTTSDCVKEREARQEEYARKQEAGQKEVMRKTLELEAIKSAEISKILRLVIDAYLPKRDLEKNLDKAGFDETKRKIFVHEATHTQAVSCISDDIIYLVFRGTEVNSFMDWYTDLDIWPTGSPKRHRGFQHAWESISNDVISWIKDHQGSDVQLVLAGHSLGGAIATVAAIELSDKWPIKSVKTYGSPRVGLRAFKDYYSNKHTGRAGRKETLGDITIRYVNSADLITSLPPPLLYCHVKEPEPVGIARSEVIQNTWYFPQPKGVLGSLTPLIQLYHLFYFGFPLAVAPSFGIPAVPGLAPSSQRKESGNLNEFQEAAAHRKKRTYLLWLVSYLIYFLMYVFFARSATLVAIGTMLAILLPLVTMLVVISEFFQLRRRGLMNVPVFIILLLIACILLYYLSLRFIPPATIARLSIALAGLTTLPFVRYIPVAISSHPSKLYSNPDLYLHEENNSNNYTSPLNTTKSNGIL